MAAGLAEGDGGTHLKTYHPSRPQLLPVVPQRRLAGLQYAPDRPYGLNRNYDWWRRTGTGPGQAGGGWRGRIRGINDAMSPRQVSLPTSAHRVLRHLRGAAGYTYGANGLFGATSRSTDRGPRWRRRGHPGRGKGAANAGAEGIQDEGGRAPRAPGSRGRKPCKCLPAAQMQYLRALIESRPMLKRIPDQWLLVNDPMGTTDRIQACRASDGSYAFIYTATGTKWRYGSWTAFTRSYRAPRSRPVGTIRGPAPQHISKISRKRSPGLSRRHPADGKRLGAGAGRRLQEFPPPGQSVGR